MVIYAIFSPRQILKSSVTVPAGHASVAAGGMLTFPAVALASRGSLG
ncbi:hypothetical protein [Leptolyngbya sp. DQ-M1]